MSGYVDTYPQTQAQWDADTRLFNNQTVAVVTDGVNIGRKKWFDGIQTFAQLDYIDAAAAGAGITSINLNTGPAIELRIPLDAMWAQINNAGAPAAGEFEASSNNDATAVTSLTFHITDAGANDQTALFASMRIGGLLTGRQTNNDGTNASGSPCIYRITAVPTLASSQYTIAVAHVSGQFIGSFPNWYVSYAGNEQTQYYNGTAVQLQEAIITGTTDGSGRLAIDMSGAPYSWTNIRAYSAGCGDGSAHFPSYLLTSANVLRVQMWDTDGNAAPADVPVIVTVKGI
jgi:hypothetical protein